MNNLEITNEAIRMAVNAELARQGKPRRFLIPVLGRGRDWVYARLNGASPLTMNDIDRIVRALGITFENLLESARFSQRLIDSRSSYKEVA